VLEQRVRLSGTGGQGLILAGQVLAEAAGLHERKNVVQTQSYGPESRGGACRAEVVISEEQILYPEVAEADILVCLSQQSYDRYAPQLGENGILVYDPFFVKVSEKHFQCQRSIPVQATEIADQVGRRVTANMVALGAVVALSEVVKLGSLESALRTKVPKGTEELNLNAFRAGVQAVRGVMSEREERS